MNEVLSDAGGHVLRFSSNDDGAAEFFDLGAPCSAVSIWIVAPVSRACCPYPIADNELGLGSFVKEGATVEWTLLNIHQGSTNSFTFNLYEPLYYPSTNLYWEGVLLS